MAPPGSGRPFSAPATMPPEAQQPPGPATEPAPAATRHLPSPWIPWPPSSPPHWLILRPSLAAAFQLLLLHWRRAHSPLLPAPPPRHRGIDPHPSCSCRRRQPSIQWFGASQHAAMAASRRRSTSAGNGCLPMQLYDERRKPAPGLAIRSANGASEGQPGGSFESLVIELHWQSTVARRRAATPAGCHCRVLTGTKPLHAGLTAAAAAWWMGILPTVTSRRCWEARRVSTPPVEEQALRGCGGDGRTASHCGGEDGARGIHGDAG